MLIHRLRANPWAVLGVMCLGLFMALLDTTIVNIAVPSIIEGLDAKFDEILWVLNAYILAYAALLITGGVQERLRGGDAPDPRCAHRDSVAGRLALASPSGKARARPNGSSRDVVNRMKVRYPGAGP